MGNGSLFQMASIYKVYLSDCHARGEGVDRGCAYTHGAFVNKNPVASVARPGFLMITYDDLRLLISAKLEAKVVPGFEGKRVVAQMRELKPIALVRLVVQRVQFINRQLVELIKVLPPIIA